jgi:hypothetical protein
VQDGVRLLEISKTIFVQTAKFKRKRKLLNFVCSNLVWKDHTLTAVFRQPFDPLAIRIRLGKEKAAGADSSGLHNLWLPTLDNLSQLFLATDRNGQFLPTATRSALWKPITMVITKPTLDPGKAQPNAVRTSVKSEETWWFSQVVLALVMGG